LTKIVCAEAIGNHSTDDFIPIIGRMGYSKVALKLRFRNQQLSG